MGVYLTLPHGLLGAAADEPQLPHEFVGKFAPVLTRVDVDSWINSPPLTWGALNGKVVLLEFWSVASWPSNRSLGFLRDLYARLKARGFEIVAVHTPEFPHENNRTALQRKIKEFEIAYPIMLDEDSAYAQAVGGIVTRPSFFVVSKRGKVTAVFEGEAQLGDAAGKAVENEVLEQLQQPG